MPNKNYLKIYDIMIKEYKDNRYILRERCKALKDCSSVFTVRYYEKEINTCNKYISALKNAKKNQITIDNL